MSTDPRRQLQQAEESLRRAQAALQQVTAEHVAAAAEARTLEADARRTDRDSGELYARRLREANVAAVECARLEARITEALLEVERASENAQGPRAAVWAIKAAALVAADARMEGAIALAVSGMATVLAATTEIRKATEAAERHKAEMRVIETAGMARIADSADPTGSHELLRRRAMEVLSAAKIRTDALTDHATLAALRASQSSSQVV
jgi:hypothetical protein